MAPAVLTDGDLIRNLLASYCRLIDAGDFDGVGQLFSAGRVCDETGTVLASGAEEIAAFYRSATKTHDDGTPLTQHLVANTFVEPVGDDHMAVTSTYAVLQATPELPLQPIITGTYVDTFVRTAEAAQWRFAERRFTVSRVGNLSHHLKVTPPLSR